MKFSTWTLAAGWMLALLAPMSPLAVADSAMDNATMAGRASAALKAALQLDMAATEQVSELILQEKFAEFENLSIRYEKAFVNDPNYESPLIKLYSAVASDNPLLLEKLDKWVATRPSFRSYAARGLYKKTLGYWARGEEYIDKTPEKNIIKMKALHKEAERDLRAAIHDNPRFSPAYLGLINVIQSSGDTEDCTSVMEQAARFIPQTYYIRYSYLECQRPRWGGDYTVMQRYVDSLDNAAQINPRIWSLKGSVAAERGYTALMDKAYDHAIQYYTQALSFGDRLEFLKYRAQMYTKTRQFDLALADDLKYQEYSPSNEKNNRAIENLRDYLKYQKYAPSNEKNNQAVESMQNMQKK